MLDMFVSEWSGSHRLAGSRLTVLTSMAPNDSNSSSDTGSCASTPGMRPLLRHSCARTVSGGGPPRSHARGTRCSTAILLDDGGAEELTVHGSEAFELVVVQLVASVEPDVGELLRPLHVLEHRENTEDVVLVDVPDHQDVDGPGAASVANPSPGGRTASALPH
jgi:hypothetical protein